MAYRLIREAVGVFHDARAFAAGVDDLLLAGFDRSLLSLLADEAAVERKLGHLLEHIDDAADDPAIPRIPFIGTRSRSLIRGMTVSTLASVGVCAVAGTVVASGGTVALAFAAAAAFGGASGALGLAVGRIIESRHARQFVRQLERGGIMLWVSTPTPERERIALEILNRHGADHVHMHDLPADEITRLGGVSEDLAWINKPLFTIVVPVNLEAKAIRSSTVH